MLNRNYQTKNLVVNKIKRKFNSQNNLINNLISKDHYYQYDYKWVFGHFIWLVIIKGYYGSFFIRIIITFIRFLLYTFSSFNFAFTMSLKVNFIKHSHSLKPARKIGAKRHSIGVSNIRSNRRLIFKHDHTASRK